MDRKNKAYLCNVLRDDRESLKWLWLLVMAFAMESAAETAYDYLIIMLAEHNFADYAGTAPVKYDQAIKGLIIFIAVFVPTFMRFVYGGSRYFDLKYMEVDHIARYQDTSLQAELGQFAKVNSLADVFFLLAHGILFVILSKSMADMQIFSIAYGVLLLANIALLLFVTRGASTPDVIRELRQTIGFPEREKTPHTWAKVNACTLAGLFVLTLLLHITPSMDAEHFFLWCTGLFFLNSVLDLWLTKDFYSPPWKAQPS